MIFLRVEIFNQPLDDPKIPRDCLFLDKSPKVLPILLFFLADVSLPLFLMFFLLLWGRKIITGINEIIIADACILEPLHALEVFLKQLYFL